ncbi:MAG: PEGA domain-containing protein [Planctomycetaceae bacterium]
MNCTHHLNSIGETRSRWLLVCLAVALCGLGSGCVHRRLTIHSEPEGALVMLDGEEVGFTPVSVDFTYYATREVKLIKDGYETMTVLEKVPAPWYQRFPADFFSEHFLPFRVKNRHEFRYKLEPKAVVPTQELLDRAGSFRSESQLGE